MSSDIKKYLYILTTGPEVAYRAASPFFLATTAALMDHDVSMVFTVKATGLLKKGVAEELTVKEGGEGAHLQFFVDQAREAGVKFYVCAPSLDLNDCTVADLIDTEGIVGGSAVNEMALDSDVVITF